jgi:polyhydroxyalkanoate synthesis regulator protein
MGTLFPFGNVEEMSRQNMVMMERAMSLFAPFYRPPGAEAAPGPAAPAAATPAAAPEPELAAAQAEIARLKRELAARKDKTRTE